MPELTGDVTIEVDDEFTLFELAGWSAAELDDILARNELPEARQPGDAAEANGWQVLRITPRVAWVIAAHGHARDWALAANGVVIDLSNSRMRFRLRGNATRLLAALVAIDFGASRSAALVATVIHGIPVTILRTEGDFDLLVPRSFFTSLLEWIEDAAKGLSQPLATKA
jgi:heterotetrameric sarcosine oxidase gamma subunit